MLYASLTVVEIITCGVTEDGPFSCPEELNLISAVVPIPPGNELVLLTDKIGKKSSYEQQVNILWLVAN